MIVRNGSSGAFWVGILFASIFMAAGCAVAVRAVGRVAPVGDTMVITSSEGTSRPLELTGVAEPMRYLDGHTVTVEGVLHKQAIQVRRWHVIEGLNGLSVWVGRLVSTPDGLGLVELDSDAVFQLDADVAPDLEPWIGQTVLVEGLIEGALGIRVMFYRPMFDEAGLTGTNP